MFLDAASKVSTWRVSGSSSKRLLGLRCVDGFGWPGTKEPPPNPPPFSFDSVNVRLGRKKKTKAKSIALVRIGCTSNEVVEAVSRQAPKFGL